MLRKTKSTIHNDCMSYLCITHVQSTYVSFVLHFNIDGVKGKHMDTDDKTIGNCVQRWFKRAHDRFYQRKKKQ